MQSEEYEYLYDLEARFWWFVGMREITSVLLDSHLPLRDRTILDAGCGTGGNLEWLARYAGKGRVVGIDLISTAIDFCRRRNHLDLVQASATDLPFADESFDLITSFDVLVQIPGAGADQCAMGEMFRVLRPGGIAFVRTAAYEWMRSGHDEALASQRRYQLPELRRKLQQSGFEILRETYANSLLLPLAAAHRLLLKPLGLADAGSDVKPLPRRLQWLNDVLKRALIGEARFLRRPRATLAAGLSAICVARKPLQ
ncbi:MAG: class I SAM-dependent methyltransferase [Acidobacteriota bacterium]